MHRYAVLLFEEVVRSGDLNLRARFEDMVLCYGAVTAYCVTSAVCLDAFLWFDFFPSAKLEIKITGFAFLFFVTVFGTVAVPALTTHLYSI